MRRCKTVSPHYINYPHKIVPKAHYRTFLCLPPPPLVPASGAPGDHRLPSAESVKPNGKQTSKSEHQSPPENMQLDIEESDFVQARRVSSMAGTHRYMEEMVSEAAVVSRGRG